MNIIYIVLATLSGAMITVSSILNAQVGKKHGVYIAALLNNFFATVIMGITLLSLYNGFGFSVESVGKVPWWAMLGGIATIIIVVGSNIVIPKMPVIYTSLLIFLGQFSMALVLDIKVNRTSISLSRILGFVLILSGLIINMKIDYKKA
ncbi:DMT family transporter [Serpentinicella sp. ANB-PHB4]|uniref:DMT family transporter n=1 Tax=Serpentinicella sp. ANB-PHB4 TaxID=3074076 RepID=UPI00285B040E|nr:DMT family transporter [Serpentinicella sp. ANB-PHB4]MDR5659147.1 DMT family transporter [Serpentinicella sp. ANB-PHB4]